MKLWPFMDGELLYMRVTCRAEKVSKSRDPKALAGGSGENWGEEENDDSDKVRAYVCFPPPPKRCWGHLRDELGKG